MFKKVCILFFALAVASFAQDDSDFDEAEESSSEEVSESASYSAPAEEETATSSRAADRAKRREFEKDQRLDEFANNLRRRDWLKDRLVFEIGMGSRQPVMGETGLGMGFGFGAEYITRWHIALFGSFGFIPSGDDPDFSNFAFPFLTVRSTTIMTSLRIRRTITRVNFSRRQVSSSTSSLPT